MSEGLRFPDPAPHVLVVDDERMIRWSLRAGLEEAGAAVEEAASLAEARRRLAARGRTLTQSTPHSA